MKKLMFIAISLVATLAVAGLVSWTFMASAADENPARDTRARYAPTPGPTPVAIEAPDEASLIDATQARRAFLELHVSAYGEVDADSVSIDRKKAGDLDPNLVTQRAADYPVWVVKARGTFHPRSLPPWATPADHQFSELTAFVDAADGTLVGITLTGGSDTSE